ncbi:primosomal protein DnaI [Alkalihalophilus pseudofirmus]|uniref:primosomal protein DnaI n=1 Tax=Alkalihalobacterium alkalinitrilicum TaxID=427920 RepID=UPI00094C9302|nr:primosomal protein DnaI [Alkalihalobacterium alkalinitrilicum]OLO27844.1 primosomal protein DnaI [Alkalihalophilus pseudofirmus]
MKSIQASLQSMMNGDKFIKQYEMLKHDILTDPIINEFMQSHPHVSLDMLERSLPKLDQYRKEVNTCNHCPGLQKCTNLMTGYRPKLVVDKQFVDIRFDVCEIKQKEDRQKKQQALIKSLYIPKDILAARFEHFDQDHEARLAASAAALEFAMQADPGNRPMGLYLYGKFGVGKTYIMGAVANELADRDIETMLVYTPDFFREMKQSIGDGTFSEKLDRVKNAQVLILDDIGAESLSSWIRDDVLGVILQYRMLENLPTLFTSNYDYDELEEHLAYSDRGGLEQLKAKRIMERIRHFTTPIYVDGENRRRRN